LNKLDMVPGEEAAAKCQAVIDALNWEGPVYEVSAINGDGTKQLCHDLMARLDLIAQEEKADPELIEAERREQDQMQQEARDRIEEVRLAYKAKKAAMAEGSVDDEDDDDWDEDDYDVEVEYVK